MAEPDNFEEDLFADLYTDDSAPQAANAAPPVKAEDAGEADVKVNQSTHEEANGGGDNQEYQDEQEMDDDIDFNLGGASGGGVTNNYDSPAHHEQQHGPGTKEDGKMFIGGLNWETTDDSLKDYFSQFGEVVECTVMRDGASGRSRGFGFLTFRDAKTVNVVMVKEHYLDGKIIDPKRAIPRDEQERTSKIFVGGVSQEATEQDFKEFFMQFGRVVDATLMMDKDTGRPRGFGFVTFDSEAAVDACLEGPLQIHGKPIEVKKAQPRGNMREEEEQRGGPGKFNKFNKFGRDDNQQNPNQMAQGNGSNQMNAQGGMTPQLMAQAFQRMQQFAMMMQQQMAMGGGRPMNMPGGMNPAMMMQMQQMQAMQAQMQAAQQGGNRSGSSEPQSPGMAGMAGMNPAMMQQMAAMQQMQQMQNMGGGNGGGGYAAGGQNNPGGRIGTPGYNAYEQQMFEQQKYEQQQMNREQSQGRGGYGQGGFAQGGNGYGNNMGGPTSWEGMYDDVPQPNAPAGNSGGGSGRGGFGGGRGGGNRGTSATPSGPVSTPPAGAPTGPKNAGKPGANYRGGGRGGNRGFHPYQR